jgi:hypothetical protein
VAPRDDTRQKALLAHDSFGIAAMLVETGEAHFRTVG